MAENFFAHDGTLLSGELAKLQARDYASCAVICDMQGADIPIVFATKEFYRVTGYRKDEVIGRNCRFLQGEETDRRVTVAIRDAIDEKKPIETEILNYTKYGNRIVNSLRLSPCFRDDGRLMRYLAYQNFSYGACTAPGTRNDIPRSPGIDMRRRLLELTGRRSRWTGAFGMPPCAVR